MCKPIQLIFYAFFIALTMSGCFYFGISSNSPGECKIEMPITPQFSVRTRADFLKAWGKPNMIKATSDNLETWIYKKHLWYGFAIAFLILVPSQLLYAMDLHE